MQNSVEFEHYCRALVLRGHSRDWIRRNRVTLEKRFEVDQVPFDCPAPPQEAVRDRYAEL